MASRFPERLELHFDSTSATIADENGEIAGVVSFSYSGGTRERGRVRAPGSRSPIDYINGAFQPSDARLTMHRRYAGPWVKQIKDENPGLAVSDVVKNFTITYAPYDEEGFLLPAQIDSFAACIDPPRGLGADQSRPGDSLTVEIPLFLVGKIKFNGAEID